MRDIVDRLMAEDGDYTPREAADEIERWRAEAARLAAVLERCGIIARAGMGGGDAGWRFKAISQEAAAAPASARELTERT